jgi:hypothetical protein
MVFVQLGFSIKRFGQKRDKNKRKNTTLYDYSVFMEGSCRRFVAITCKWYGLAILLSIASFSIVGNTCNLQSCLLIEQVSVGRPRPLRSIQRSRESQLAG